MNISREERICKLCNLSVGNEYHFVLVCNTFTALREKYIPRKFYIRPNIHKFNILMSSKTDCIISNLAKYVYFAFRQRKEALEF